MMWYAALTTIRGHRGYYHESKCVYGRVGEGAFQGA